MIFLDSEGIGIRRIIFFFKIIATSFEYENRRRETWTVHFCQFFSLFCIFSRYLPSERKCFNISKIKGWKTINASNIFILF